MNLLAPPELRKIAPLLTAGEDVRWIGKPSLSVLGIYGVAVVGAALIVLLIFMSLFSDLPMVLKITASLVFAVLATAVIYIYIAARTYVITDKRVLIVSDLSSTVSEAADADEIEGIEKGGFGNPLTLHKKHGKPMRLFALADQAAAEAALTRTKQSGH